MIGLSVPVAELLDYGAVFLGTDAGLPYFLGLAGENFFGIYSVNKFLTPLVYLMGANRFLEMDTLVKREKKSWSSAAETLQ